MKNQIKITAIELHKVFNSNFAKYLKRRTDKARIKLVNDLKALNELRAKEGITVLTLPSLERA